MIVNTDSNKLRTCKAKSSHNDVLPALLCSGSCNSALYIPCPYDGSTSNKDSVFLFVYKIKNNSRIVSHIFII